MLAGLGPGGLFVQALGHQPAGVGLFQRLHQFQIFSGIGVHRLHELRLCLRNGFNLRRNDIPKILQTHITLALDAEAGNAMPRDLRQESAGNALNPEGKAGMLNGAGMPQVRQFLQKSRRLFRRESFQKGFDMGIRIAELCGCRHRFFGFIGMCDQLDQHECASFLFCDFL